MEFDVRFNISKKVMGNLKKLSSVALVGETATLPLGYPMALIALCFNDLSTHLSFAYTVRSLKAGTMSSIPLCP